MKKKIKTQLIFGLFLFLWAEDVGDPKSRQFLAQRRRFEIARNSGEYRLGFSKKGRLFSSEFRRGLPDKTDETMRNQAISKIAGIEVGRKASLGTSVFFGQKLLIVKYHLI